MEIKSSLKNLAKLFRDEGYTLYIVGGYVRDMLLNFDNNDIDITSNMPYEKVIDIINDMKQDDKDNYIIIENREEAITKAFEIAEENDIILVAGKGRDTYMAIEDRKEKYCDLDVINKLIEKYKKHD